MLCGAWVYMGVFVVCMDNTQHDNEEGRLVIDMDTLVPISVQGR